MSVEKQPSIVLSRHVRELPRPDKPFASNELDGVTEEEISEFAGCQVVTTFGSRLKKAREDQRLSQDEVAKAAGVTRQTIGAWEGGAKPDPMSIRPDRIGPAAELMKVSVDWLIFGTGEPAAEKSSDPEIEGLKSKLVEVKRDLRKALRTIEDITED